MSSRCKDSRNLTRERLRQEISRDSSNENVERKNVESTVNNNVQATDAVKSSLFCCRRPRKSKEVFSEEFISTCPIMNGGSISSGSQTRSAGSTLETGRKRGFSERCEDDRKVFEKAMNEYMGVEEARKLEMI